ncbi:MAG: DUF1549 domain-containing protein, partial [Gemmataceae bacterium]
MPSRRLAHVAVSLLTLTALGSAVSAAPPDFDRDVMPILASRCLECHTGADGKGGLDLTRKAAVAPVVSELWKKVAANDMPPKKPLPDAEKTVLKAWIESGAAWGTDPIDPFARTVATRAGRDWWSLQPVKRPEVPKADGTPNPIDRFILARLEKTGLTPAPPADKRTLIRRVYFDLLGLPPTFEQVEAFAEDDSPDAYEKLIDTLLASPHYGERWGRHWLDVARYAETCGYERDQVKPNVWKYRDWVIAAFNADLPFDRFVREQLAGDEMPNASEQSVIATGFIR